jgi:hypothetical protein
MTKQVMVVSPEELRPGDEVVGRQKHGAIDKVWPEQDWVVEVGVGEHPIVGGECIQLRRRATDPPWYDLNLWNGQELFR